MGGIAFRDDELIVERGPNDLDELAIRFTSILDELGIEHVYVLGYMSILTGRSRATEDIDVLLERLDERTVIDLAAQLGDEELWDQRCRSTRWTRCSRTTTTSGSRATAR